MSMPVIHQLHTPRLLLRQWQASDFPAFARLNADAHTMRYFAAPLDDAQSDALAKRCRDLIAQRGWGVWAVQNQATGGFIGAIGLHVPDAALPIAPCVEIAWRLCPSAWGLGFATEGARATLAFAFDTLHLPEVVAYTTISNTPSQRVMERLGMQRDAATFAHPALPADHPLREHCVYRAAAPHRDLHQGQNGALGT